jgi:hypothetical protein
MAAQIQKSGPGYKTLDMRIFFLGTGDFADYRLTSKLAEHVIYNI